MPKQLPDHDTLLTPREVAEHFGVGTSTIALWARQGKLAAVRTPGGHRRYRLQDIQQVVTQVVEPNRQMIEDAIRLYNDGWSIRQIAHKFDKSYGAIRRLLLGRVTFRSKGRTITPKAMYPPRSDAVDRRPH